MAQSSPGKPKLSFDTVFYYVTNIEASIAFYRDKLGLPLVSHDYVARFELDGVLIELVPAPSGMAVHGSGNARLCFAVDDLKAAAGQLRQQGINSSEIKHKKGGDLAFFRDPDGNELCLWQYEEPEGVKELVKSAELH